MSELNGSFGQADGLVGTLGTANSLYAFLAGGNALSLTGQLGGSLIPGPQGPQGEKGEKGDKGDRGEKGDTGPQGPRGETGERGPTGETGAQGPQGETGPAGPKGDKGDAGEHGETGPKGDTGEPGPKGDTGPAGPTGPQGVKGDKGDPGDDYILTQQDKQDIAGLVDTPVAVDGTTPVINAKSGVRYVCGECATVDIAAPESGIIDVTFTSGSTPTVLTVTTPEGMTMMWANNFDPADLDANTTYEINIMDGCKGVACSWT